jgi:hypothetical protein
MRLGQRALPVAKPTAFGGLRTVNHLVARFRAISQVGAAVPGAFGC